MTFPWTFPATLDEDTTPASTLGATLYENISLDDVRTALLTGTPADAMRVATQAAATIQEAPTQITVDIYDKFYKRIATCGDYISLQASWPRNKTGTGHLILKDSDPLAEKVLQCHETTVPVVIEVGTLRWSGRVDIAHDKFGDPTGPDTVECELLGDYAFLTRIIAWSNFLFPIELQFPSRGWTVGGAVSVVKSIIATQYFRWQSGIWSLINNLGNLNLDWRTWISQALMQDPGGDGLNFDDVMRMLRTPVYVIPTDALTDTSPLTSATWRFDKVSDVIEQIVADNGLSVDVCVWLPGDPQPHDDILFPLTSPTIVVDVKDRTGITGPTGTFLDGVLRVLVDIQGSLFGKLLDPLLNPEGKYVPDGFNIAPAVGVDFVQPWCWFNCDDVRSGVRGQLDHHHPQAVRVIAGGRSPKWLDDLINATTSFLLDMAMIVVGFTGVPSDLLNGLFNDMLFAFQLVDLMDRKLDMGPYALPEVFIPTEHGTYQLNMLFTILKAIDDTKGYVSGIVKFDQGYPYTLGKDVFPNALGTMMRRAKVYTDYFEDVTLVDTRGVRTEVIGQLGDGKAEEPASAKLQRRLVDSNRLINAALMSPQ